VSYSFPLPHEAAVSAYEFKIGARRVVGEIDRKASARERFEQALLEGRTAGIVEQDRSTVFSQDVGNIPPGEEVIVKLTIDQRLRWLEEGAWEWRFPMTVAPRYLGAPGRVADAGRISQDVADRATGVTMTASLFVRDETTGGIESPSHALHVHDARATVAASPLDRDVVVRWRVARASAVSSLEVGRPEKSADAYALLTVVPPDARPVAVARDLWSSSTPADRWAVRPSIRRGA
jgi:Ca-activated chloride channel family protein